MSKLIIILVALFGVAYSAPSIELQDTKALVPIGEFDGKMFYVDNTDTATVEAANVTCSLFRFSLLTLGSRQEFDWLREHLSLTQRYWTSGKDTATYKWELGTGQIVEKTTYNVVPIHPTCLVILGDRLYTDPCDGSLGFSYYTICQNPIIRQNDAQQ